MKKLFTLLLITLTTLFCNAQTWNVAGTTAYAPGGALYASLVVNGGSSYVAYVDGVTYQASVKKFDGTSWVVVGDASFSPAFTTNTVLAFDGSTPYVAFMDPDNANRATVKKLVGATWETVGTAGFSELILNTNGALGFVINNGTPLVAYTVDDTDYRITAMQFDGVSWIAAGTPGFSSLVAGNLSLVSDGTTAYIAFADTDNGSKATVMQFDGTDWTTTGDPGFSSADTYAINVAVNAGTPYVAYSDGTETNKLTVMKLVGAVWTSVGTAGFTSDAINYPSLAFDGSTPYIGFSDAANANKATVMKFTTGSWSTVGTAGFSNGEAQFVNLAFNGSIPFVSYNDNITSPFSNDGILMQFTTLLPLRLLSFTGNTTDKGNQLQWLTEAEINTKEFDIERSADGRAFSVIESVAARPGVGGRYNYSDNVLVNGKLYYRLKMIDIDGKFTYSNIIALTNALSNVTSIYPNPAKGATTLQVGNKNLIGGTARLSDMHGKVLKAFVIKNNFEIIDMSSYPAGLYLLQLPNGSTQKIIKE